MNTKNIIVIAGLPCSGKTTYAKKLIEEDSSIEFINVENFLDIITKNSSFPILNFNRHWVDYIINIMKTSKKEYFLIDGINANLDDNDIYSFTTKTSVNKFINYLSEGLVEEKANIIPKFHVFYINAPYPYRLINAAMRYKNGFKPANFFINQKIPEKRDFQNIQTLKIFYADDIFDTSYIPHRVIERESKREQERLKREEKRLEIMKHNKNEYSKIIKSYKEKIFNLIEETDFKTDESKNTIYFIIDDAPLKMKENIIDIVAKAIPDSKIFLKTEELNLISEKNIIYKNPIEDIGDVLNIISKLNQNSKYEYRIIIFEKNREQWNKIGKVYKELKIPEEFSNEYLLDMRRVIGYKNLQIKFAVKKIIFDNINIL